MGLDDPAAQDPALTGSKAAALATPTARGRRVLPGAVLTTGFTTTVPPDADLAAHPALRDAYLRVGGTDRALVARSSSVAEDTAAALDGRAVRLGHRRQRVACACIGGRGRARASGRRFGGGRADGGAGPAVARARLGGVLFGVDPVSGRTDRRVVSAVRGGPEPLVSGRQTGSRYELGRSGQVLLGGCRRRTPS